MLVSIKDRVCIDTIIGTVSKWTSTIECANIREYKIIFENIYEVEWMAMIKHTLVESKLAIDLPHTLPDRSEVELTIYQDYT